MAATLAQGQNWELTPARRTPQFGAMLRVGARAIPVTEIQGFIASTETTKDRRPAFATLAVFGVMALFFLLGVLDLGWRQRFLAAAILFGGIALAALHDMAWLTASGIHRVEILTRSGETIRYATVDPREQQALIGALGAIVGKSGQPPANDPT